jgi:hypothetical protein
MKKRKMKIYIIKIGNANKEWNDEVVKEKWIEWNFLILYISNSILY